MSVKKIDRIILACAWLTLVFAVGELIFTSKANYFNSDLLFVEDLAKDIFHFHGLWSDWSLPPAPDYVPAMALYFLGYALFPSTGAHIYFTTACEAFLLAGVLVWLARRIKPAVSSQTVAAIVFLVALTTYVSAFSGMMLYFNTTNWHVSSLLFSLLSLGLFLIFIERGQAAIAALIVLCMGLAQVSDAIYVISFLAPTAMMLIGGMIGTYVYPTFRQARHKLSIGLSLLIAGEVLTKILGKLVTFNSSFTSDRVPVSKQGAIHSWKIFYQATIDAFGRENKLTMLYSLMVLAAFVYLVTCLIRFMRKQQAHVQSGVSAITKSGWRLTAAGVFTILVIGCNLGGDIISGGLVDPGGYRYLTVPISMILLMSLLLLESESGWLRRIPAFLALLAALTPPALLLGYILVPKGQIFTRGSKTVAEIFSVPQNLSIQETESALCFSEFQKQSLGLQSGVSNYWLARGVTEQLPEHNPILALNPDMLPYFWMATMGPLYRHDIYPRYYNFLILPLPGPYAPTDFTTVTIGPKFPQDHKTYLCPKGRTEFWIYENDSLNQMVQAAENEFLFKRGKSGNMVFSAAQLLGSVGKIIGKNRVARSPDDKAGIVSFGPYINLQGGRYKITLNYVAQSDKDQVLGSWDVIGAYKNSSHIVTLYADQLRKTMDGHISTIIDIPSGGIRLLEFRSMFAGQGLLEIKSFEIARLK